MSCVRFVYSLPCLKKKNTDHVSLGVLPCAAKKSKPGHKTITKDTKCVGRGFHLDTLSWYRPFGPLSGVIRGLFQALHRRNLVPTLAFSSTPRWHEPAVESKNMSVSKRTGRGCSLEPQFAGSSTSCRSGPVAAQLCERPMIVSLRELTLCWLWGWRSVTFQNNSTYVPFVGDGGSDSTHWTRTSSTNWVGSETTASVAQNHHQINRSNPTNHPKTHQPKNQTNKRRHGQPNMPTRETGQTKRPNTPMHDKRTQEQRKNTTGAQQSIP